MATQPKKELTEAEQYAAEEKARIEAIEAKKVQDEEDAANAKAESKPADAKPAAKTANNRRATAKSKPKERIEEYTQRGPKGLFKVTRNVDTGQTSAELIEE